MQLQWEKCQIPVLRTKVWEVQNQEQTLELRLGEDMPDIGHVICGWGQAVLRGKDWQSDSVRVSGGVMAWILYAPEDGSAPKSVEAWLPFALKWNMPAAERDGMIRCDVRVRAVDARVLSARKMMVRAQLSALGEALEPDTAMTYTPGEMPAGIHLLRHNYPVRLRAEAGEKQIQLDEDLPFSGIRPQKIISCCIMPRLTEQKVVGGRAVFRGDCGVHLVYFGEDDMIHSEDQSVSFAQFADLDKDYDKETTLDTVMAVSNLEPELMEDGLRIKASLVCQYVILENRMVELARDAYSTENYITPDWMDLELPVVLDKRREERAISQSAPGEYMDIVDVSCFAEQPVTHRNGNLVEVQQPGMMQVLCRGADGQYSGIHIRFADQWNIPAGENSNIKVWLDQPDAPTAAFGAEGIEAGFVMHMQTMAETNESIPVISGITVGEKKSPQPDRPSLILRRAGEESLWELAKSYGSTVDAIRAANGISDSAAKDQMLLIPIQ